MFLAFDLARVRTVISNTVTSEERMEQSGSNMWANAL